MTTAFNSSIFFLDNAINQEKLDRYQTLVKQAAELGTFLTFYDHQPWLNCYAQDAGSLNSHLPLLVFKPWTINHISPFVKLCAALKIPITTRCAGTGISGGAVASRKGILLLTNHFKKLKLNHNRFVAEPGVTCRDLNFQSRSLGYEFPLPMATNGVAGLAGCLSMQAVSYDQQCLSIWDQVEKVTLIDGEGNLRTLPASFVCGAEGVFGVITEIYGQLLKIPLAIWRGKFQVSWQEVENLLPQLRQLTLLTVLSWSQGVLTFQLEGSIWQLECQFNELEMLFHQQLNYQVITERVDLNFSLKQKNKLFFGSVLMTRLFAHFETKAQNLASQLNLTCKVVLNPLTNHLLCLLASDQLMYDFQTNVTQFLVVWCNALANSEGSLSHCPGIGLQLSPFISPFMTQERLSFLKHGQRQLDPLGLFAFHRYFPSQGKSLEKIREYS